VPLALNGRSFEFHWTGRPILPLASVDTAGLVIYIGTWPKVLAPGCGSLSSARRRIFRKRPQFPL